MWVRDSDGGRLWIEDFGREEFLSERWHYEPGQHISPELPVVRFGLKPRDKVLTAQCRELDIRIVRDWPPLYMGHPNGWTLWPKFTDDPDADDYRVAPIVLKALRWIYRNAAKQRRRGMIIDADEMEEIQRLLALIGRIGMIRGLYRRLRSNGGGLVTGCQAPKYLVTDAYSQCQHLFLGNDPEKRNRDRFGEIGGVDPKVVDRTVKDLPERHWLYLRRRGRVMCIVGP
jgi:hypothetical protein